MKGDGAGDVAEEQPSKVAAAVAQIEAKQDVQPVLDYTSALRNSGEHDKVGDFNRYAMIPAHVEIALRKKGINIYNKYQTKELLKEINQNYPYLKVTNLHHEVK